MNIKDIFDKAENGTLTFEQFEAITKDNKAKFADLSEGNYVSKSKYDDDIGAKDGSIQQLNDTIAKRDTDLADLQAKLKERRTFAEAIATVLAQKPSEEVKKELNLDSTADNLDAVIAAMLRQATRGNVKAGDFLRDTIGQKPSDRLEATVENLTAEDREMLENIKSRLGES